MKKSQAKIKKSFTKFKRIVESKLGRINWKKVGVYSIAILLFVASKGVLGLKAQIVASQIIRYAAYA